MPPMITHTPADKTEGLTGAYRFRPSWLGKVVLEVEYLWTGLPAHSYHGGTFKHWRHATPLDLADPILRGLIDGGRV